MAAKKKPKAKPKRTAAKSVDDYLAALPAPARAALTALRAVIQAAAPEATDGISYQIPTFKQNGPLVAFAAFEDHLSFYVMSPATARKLASKLKDYVSGAATLQFTTDEPLPVALVTEVVKARVKENEQLRKR